MADSTCTVIFGANGGIGSELSRQLRANGRLVWLAGRNETGLRSLSEELDSPFDVVDVRDVEATAACLQKAASELGTVKGVVNLAGSVLLKPAHLTTLDEWEDALATNLTSAFSVVRGSIGVLRKEGGSIVLMSSAAARLGLANHEAIAAAKAGVIGLARSAAASYAKRNIRVNAVAPGLVQTGLTERIWQNEKSADASRALHALGRLGTPKDVASLIALLVDDSNSWITGQVFGVDGGLGTIH